MRLQKTSINKNKKKWMISHNLSLIVFLLLILYSCNLPNRNLLGHYKIKEAKGALATNKSIELLTLKKNGLAEIVYNDTTINGRWDEIDVQELNYIELITGGKLYELHIIKDSSIELYFVSNATDFRGGLYDSLRFIKINR